MALYQYKALDRSGKEIKAVVNGDSESLAKQKIKAQGLMIIEIKEQKSGKNKKDGFNLGPSKKVSSSDLALFTRQFATLIRAKIQIVESLSALIEQATNPHMRVVLSEVRQKVNEGSSLARALADYPKIFDIIYTNMVEAGEASGNLEIVLLRLAEFTENQQKLKSKVRGAMTYPLIMLLVAAVMMTVLFTVVIPKIARLFKDTKKELPTLTKITIAISDIMLNYWWAIILGIFVTQWLFFKYIATSQGKMRWHRVLLGLPIMGEIITMINVGRFCSTLATLLNAGVPILLSLRIVKNLVSNVHMQQAIEDAKNSVTEGGALASPLIKSKLFPPMVTQMISLGEKSGELEPMLKIVAENYEDQVNGKLSGLTSILEPIMMVGMGIGVGLIVFAVVVPLLEMNNI